MSQLIVIEALPRHLQVQYALNEQLCVLAQAAAKVGLDQAAPYMLRPEDQAKVDAIPQQPFVELPLPEKLRLLQALANKLGLYDAADFMHHHQKVTEKLAGAK